MKKTLWISLLMCGVFGVSAAQTVQIDEKGRAENLSKIPPKSGLNQQDRKFIQFANASNLFEVRFSQALLKRAKGAWAREFARDMIREHSAAHEQLKLLARDKGVALSERLPADMQAKIDRINRLSAQEAERTYRQEQLKAHEETAKMMERQIKNGSDSMVRNYAVKMLPGVKMHHELAMQRMSMTGNTTRMGRKAATADGYKKPAKKQKDR